MKRLSWIFHPSLGTLIFAFCCSIYCSTGTSDAAEFDDLLRRVPDSANTLIVLDVSSILDSKLAQQEGWRETYSDKYAATPLILPPKAEKFLLGSELDIESMEPKWQVASMELSFTPSIEDVRARTGGIIDSLSGMHVIWPQPDVCVAKFGASEFGLLSPTNRQSASRWIARAREDSDVLSPYLRQAARYARGAGPEVIMAIDLQHIMRPADIRAAVERSELLRELAADDVTGVLSSLRGVTLGVRVSDRIRGKLIVDFARDASLLEPVAKPLILQVLAKAGASIDEFDQWTPSVDGPRVSIQGPLTTDGMRRMFSLVSLDAAIVNREVEEPTPSEPDEDAVALASYRYFKTIEKYLNDIQRPSRKKDTVSEKALWINNYARRIEKLPKRNVDPDLVNYASRVVYLMRDSMAHAQGIAQRAAEQVSTVRPRAEIRVGSLPTANVNNYGGLRVREYAPMAFANVDVGSAISARNSINAATAEEYEKFEQEAQQIIGQIQSETDAIRQEMTTRYNRQF